MSKGRILVTGGAGYIGSHTVFNLLETGYDVVVLDSLVNSSAESLNRVRKMTGCFINRLVFFEVDVCNIDKKLEEDLSIYLPFVSCIHFCGLKAVGESVEKPLLYYENNLISTFSLLKYLDKIDCKSLVFSSSATVYGSTTVPITENNITGVGITNPYGRTKYMIEEILKDYKKSFKKEISITTLRYFNPIGNHPSGNIGEDPNGIPNNLMPFVSQVAVGKRPHVNIFGNDYNTKDGTGVRDYIHVVDLADAHICAIEFMMREGNNKYSVFNIGTGIGYSVLEMIKGMENACGHEIPYKIMPRREGDIAECFADSSLAQKELKWSPKRGLKEMCEDLWKWQSKNPNGYKS